MEKNRKRFLDKDTIKEGWSDTFYQSMESKRRKYIDKVIKFLVIDTKVDYEDNHIDFPFFPSYRLYINDENLGYYYHKDRFIKYCRDQYGLTEEETVYVWFKYNITVKNNIKTGGGTINESDDRRKNFLDKVVDFIVKDTKVDYDSRELFFPFTLKRSLRQNSDNSTPFHKMIFNRDSIIPRDGFMEYIDEMYGVSSIEEISYVWGKYKDVMRYNVFGNDPTNEPIYESEKGSINEDSRQDLIDKVDERVKKYLDKVVDFILKETVIDYGIDKFNPVIKDEVLWYPPFSERPYSHRQSMYNTGANYDFNNYCQEVFSIFDEGEQLYVWERYRKLLGFKMRNMMINESDDKKQVYLNKVVDWLVGDTEVDVNHNWFSPPYYYTGSSAGRTGFRSVYEHTFGLLRDTNYSGLDTQLIYFNHYCKNNYGLTGEETKVVWFEYMKQLKESYDWRF